MFINLWKMHRDPRVWSDPLLFKPERFLPQLDGGVGSEAAHMDFRGQHFEYLPFGSGRRMCPAFNSATQLLHMALARLLHAFDFDTGGLVIDMTEGQGLSSHFTHDSQPHFTRSRVVNRSPYSILEKTKVFL